MAFDVHYKDTKFNQLQDALKSWQKKTAPATKDQEEENEKILSCETGGAHFFIRDRHGTTFCKVCNLHL